MAFQLGWTSPRHGVSYSTGRFWKRFAITARTDGYTVIDSTTGDVARTTTVAAARAWAGIRVGEQVVRQPTDADRRIQRHD